MAKIAQETIKHPIEIVDQPEETSGGKRFNFWLLTIPAALVVGGGIFFVVSRILSKEK